MYDIYSRFYNSYNPTTTTIELKAYNDGCFRWMNEC